MPKRNQLLASTICLLLVVHAVVASDVNVQKEQQQQTGVIRAKRLSGAIKGAVLGAVGGAIAGKLLSNRNKKKKEEEARRASDSNTSS